MVVVGVVAVVVVGVVVASVVVVGIAVVVVVVVLVKTSVITQAGGRGGQLSGTRSGIDWVVGKKEVGIESTAGGVTRRASDGH